MEPALGWLAWADGCEPAAIGKPPVLSPLQSLFRPFIRLWQSLLASASGIHDRTIHDWHTAPAYIPVRPGANAESSLATIAPSPPLVFVPLQIERDHFVQLALVFPIPMLDLCPLDLLPCHSAGTRAHRRTPFATTPTLYLSGSLFVCIYRGGHLRHGICPVRKPSLPLAAFWHVCFLSPVLSLRYICDDRNGPPSSIQLPQLPYLISTKSQPRWLFLRIHETKQPFHKQ